jgi:hypothetical protein
MTLAGRTRLRAAAALAALALLGALDAAPASAQKTAGPKTGGATTALLSGQPPAAPAAGPITGYSRGTVQTLPVSGTASTNMETILAPGNGWIYGLEIGEKSDQPCYLGIWSVEGAAPAPGFPTAFLRCDGDVNQTSVKTLGFEYARTSNAWNALRQYGPTMAMGLPIYSEVRAIGGLLALSNAHPPAPIIDGTPVALDGVGICQRSSNQELKGLRAHGSSLITTGARVTTAPIVTTEAQVVSGATIPAGVRRNAQTDRPNCNSWKEIQTCPADQVLVGLDVHYRLPTVGNQKRARITGLAPKCARVNILR